MAKSPAAAKPLSFSAPMVRALLAGRKTQTRRPCEVQPVWVEGANAKNDVGLWSLIWHDRYTGEPNHAIEETLDPILADLVRISRLQVGDQFYISEQMEVLQVLPSSCGQIVSLRYLSLRYLADGMERLVDLPDRVKVPKATGKRWPGRVLPIEWARPQRYEVTEVRAERLSAITVEDAFAEGIQLPVSPNGGLLVDLLGAGSYLPAGCLHWSPEELRPTLARAEYFALWDSIYGKRSDNAVSKDPVLRAYTFRPVEVAL